MPSTRRLEGTSNNKDHVRWGAAEEDLVRDAPSMYADGIALPAGACTPEQKQNGNCRYMDAVNGFGSNRPSPRKISNELFQQVGYTRIWVYDDIRGVLIPAFGNFQLK